MNDYYRVEVIADNSGTWAGNGLMFKEEGEAEDWAKGLYNRWSSCQKWRVIHKTDAGEEVVKEME